MADGDVSDAKFKEIFDARRWLKEFRQYSSREEVVLDDDDGSGKLTDYTNRNSDRLRP